MIVNDTMPILIVVIMLAVIAVLFISKQTVINPNLLLATSYENLKNKAILRLLLEWRLLDAYTSTTFPTIFCY